MGRRGKGEGSIYRRASDGKWVGVLELGWVEGRRRRRLVYGSTRRGVVEKLAALRRAQEQGVDLLAPPRTVGQWLEEWLTDVKAHDGTRGSTLARYRQVVRVHLAPGLGRVRLDQLTARDVQRFLVGRSAVLSPASVVKVHAVLRVALGDAERLELVARNAARSVRAPRLARQERRVLTPAEARRFLDLVATDRLEAVIVLAVTLGLRRGEVLGLRWADVDLGAGLLRVERALQRVGGDLRLVEPKTRGSARSLRLPSLAIAALERQRARQAAERLRIGPAWQESDLVFTTPIGTPMEPRNVSRRFDQMRREAGLEWLRFHDLRHACATFLLASGMEPRTVMEVLGHSTIRLTMDLYGHVLPERMSAAAAAMDEALGGG